MITSHRVEAEADRASRAHAKKTLKRQSTSAARVHDRVAARETAKRLKCLQACPIFASLAEASIGAIVDAMEYEVAKPGHVLCQQGRKADRMFLLMSGTCDVLVGDAKVAQLTDLDVFGEAALFPDATGAFVRTATVRVAGGAGAPARLLVLHKSALGSLLESGAMGGACVAHLMRVAEQRRENREHFAHDDGAAAPRRWFSGKSACEV
jgi:hypothetical protein